MTFLFCRAFRASLARSGRVALAVSSFAVIAFALLGPVSHAQAEFRQVPSGRIAIDVGGAFTPSDRFPGFVDTATGAFFAVIDLPAEAYDKLKAIPDSPEALANEGFGGTEKAELKGRQGTFIYLVGKQNTPEGDITKFVLIFPERDLTGIIVANVPQRAIEAGTYSREGIETILATAVVREKPAEAAPPPKPAATADLFRFNHLGPFKEAFDDGGMTKAYNLSGSQPHTGENRLLKESMLLVSSSIHGDMVDVKAQANHAFLQLGGVKDRRIDNAQDVTIADLKGYQIDGEVTDATSGNKIAVHLVLLSGQPFGYFMFLGSAPTAEKDKMMPEIEKVIASFELVK